MKKGIVYKRWSIINLIFTFVLSIIGFMSAGTEISLFADYKDAVWNIPTFQILCLFSIILWGIGEILDKNKKQ